MSVPDIKEPFIDITYDKDVALIDERKDYILQHLSIPDLQTFNKEIEAEVLMRKSTVDRYNKYIYQIGSLRNDFMKKRQEELNKLEKELEVGKTKIRKRHMKEDNLEEALEALDKEEKEESEEEESEEEEKPKKAKRQYCKRYNKKKL
jgi:hypothetical protein